MKSARKAKGSRRKSRDLTAPGNQEADQTSDNQTYEKSGRKVKATAVDTRRSDAGAGGVGKGRPTYEYRSRQTKLKGGTNSGPEGKSSREQGKPAGQQGNRTIPTPRSAVCIWYIHLSACK